MERTTQLGIALLFAVGGAPAALAQPASEDTSIRAGDSVLYKCVARGGTIVYQDQPCEPGDPWTGRTTYSNRSLRDNDRDNVPNNDGKTRVVYNAPIPVVVSDSRDVRRAACKDAKARREAVLRDIGLDRTFDLLRQLDDMVTEACRGL